MKIQFSRIKNIELIFLNSSNKTYEIIQFEIKLKWEERCKCTEFHLPPLSRKLLTRNIPKDGYFFLPLPTYVFLKSVPNTILAQILPQLRSKKLVSGVHSIYHGAPCAGEGAVTRGNEIFFYSLLKDTIVFPLDDEGNENFLATSLLHRFTILRK